MTLVLNTDFKDQYKIAQDCYTDLDPYIEKYEKYYLVRLLGADLYALFIADLDGAVPQEPQTSPYTEIFEAFEIDDGSCLYISEGMRTMLIQFIYFHFVRDNTYKNTTTGVVSTNKELGINLAYDGYNLVEAYNEGISNYQIIQWYICDNPSDYPLENVQPLPFASGI